MLGTMRTVAAAGMALATAGAAYAGGPDFSFRLSIGGCGPVICPPAPCKPVVRYRQETVCDTVPRTEVWYDCGRRHERIVYEKVYRTVWVPIEDCHAGTTIVIRDDDDWKHRGHGWNDRDRDRGRGHDRRDRHAGGGWDDRRGDDRGFGDGRGSDHREPARLADGQGGSGRLIPTGPRAEPAANGQARVISASASGAERLMARANNRR